MQNYIVSGKAANVSSTIPLDLRLSVSNAEQLLQMRLPGVNEVISEFREGNSKLLPQERLFIVSDRREDGG